MLCAFLLCNFMYEMDGHHINDHNKETIYIMSEEKTQEAPKTKAKKRVVKPKEYNITGGDHTIDIETMENGEDAIERYRPVIVVYNKEGKREAEIDLPEFRTLAYTMADLQMVLNLKMAESARLAKTKQIRKDLGEPNHTANIRPHRLIEQGISDIRQKMSAIPSKTEIQEREEWIRRHEEAFQQLPVDSLHMGFPGIRDPEILSENERQIMTGDRSLEELKSIVRQMEWKVNISNKYRLEREEQEASAV